MSWIKVHDSIRDEEVWNFKPFSPGQAWIELNQRAAWKDTEGNRAGVRFEIPRGCLSASVRELAEAWGWKRTKTEVFLKWLKKRTLIRTLNISNKVSLIEIVNYKKEQDETDTELDTERTLNGHSSIRKKNIRIIDYIEPCGSTSEVSTHILEKRVKNKTTVNKSVPARKISWPTLTEVEAYASEVGMPASDGAYMFYHWEGNGYTNGGKPIKSWKGTFQAWRLARHLPSQKTQAGNGEDYEAINPVFTES